jgi:hypothetical protein
MTRTQLLGTAAALLLAGVVVAMRPTEAQQPASIDARSGFHVERVTVQGACVVIVSRVERTGSGSGDYLAAVPCGG